MRKPATPAILLVGVLVACGPGQASEGDDASTSTPDWSACSAKDESQTCAEVCAAEGTTCVAQGCAADPEFCDPEPCDMATRVMGLGEDICEDPSLGGYIADACDAPIDWLFSDTVRCCCAQEE